MPNNSPEETISAFVQCVQAQDLSGLLALYETDALFIPALNTRVEGHAALGEAFRSTLALKPALDVKPVEVLRNGRLAWIENAWTLHATAPDGTPIERSGHSSVVMRRQDDGTWRIAIDRL